MADFAEEPPKAVNPYKTLGLSKTSTAAEVKTAYKKLALKHHPGTNPIHRFLRSKKKPTDSIFLPAQTKSLTQPAPPLIPNSKR